MKIELQLAKIGIFDFELNRAGAVKRIISGNEDAVWFLDDIGLTYAFRNPDMACSFTKALSLSIPNVDNAMAIENGFDIKKTPKHSIGFSMLRLTHHALERWEERCIGDLPTIREFQKVGDHHGAELTLSNTPSGSEFFIPVRAGALVGILQSKSLKYDTISEVKTSSFIANYQWSESKRRWVGEFPRIKTSSIVTTFLGWDELQRGGAYNTVDWYKVQMQLAESNETLTKMIYGGPIGK